MSEHTSVSDKGLGIGLALAAIAVLGAVVLYGGAEQIDRAWGFAVAMIAATLSVAAFQLYE